MYTICSGRDIVAAYSIHWEKAGIGMKYSMKYIKSIIRFLLTILGIALAVFIAVRFIRFFMPFVIGWIISMIANPLVRFAESRMKLIRKHSSMLIIILVLALIVGGGYLLITKVVTEVGALVVQAPDLYNGFREEFSEVEKNLDGFLNQLPEDIQISIGNFQENVTTEIGNLISNISQWAVSWAGAAAKQLPNMLIGIIFTILSAYFFTADRDKILEFGRENTPVFIQKKWKFLSENFRKVIGGYLKAQLKIMAIVWVILGIGFLILRIDFAVFVAFFVAFLDFLPFFGTGTALIPWALFKVLSGEPQIAIGLIIIYLLTQLCRRLLEPKLVSDSMGISPLWTLIFMYAGYKLYGVLGMLLAVPIGAILINFYKVGAFNQILSVSRMALEDFYQWLRPQNEEDDNQKEQKDE